MITSTHFDVTELANAIKGVRVNKGEVELASSSLSHWVYTDKANYKGSFKEDFASLTEEDFVRIAFELLSTAKRNYFSLNRKMSQIRIFDQVQKMQSDRVAFEEKIIAEANEKYKKEYYRNRFIIDSMKKWDESRLDYLSVKEGRPLDCFFFDNAFGSSNSIREYSMEKDEIAKNALWRIYNEIKDMEICKHFKGIRFFYHTSDKYLSYSFPTFEFIMDDEGKEIVKNNKESLCQAMERFYANTTYFGD